MAKQAEELDPSGGAGGRGAGAWVGWVAVFAVTAGAYAIHLVPVAPFRVMDEGGVRQTVSASMIAIVLGVIVATFIRLPRGGARVASDVCKWALGPAIVLTGAGLDLRVVGEVGLPSLVVIVAGIAIAVAAAWVVGGMLGLGKKSALLIGVGTGFCGNLAIFAVAPIVRPRDKDLALSVAMVNLYGLIAMLLLPVLGGLLGMGGEAFGVWAGSAVHAVPQAIAAGFAHSGEGGELATLVKLVRVALLAPAAVLISIAVARRGGAERSDVHPLRLVPWFLWGFIGVALANTLGLLDWQVGGLDRSASSALGLVGSFLFVVCMGAIGLGLDLRTVAGTGARGLATGLVAAVALAGGTLLLVMGLL